MTIRNGIIIVLFVSLLLVAKHFYFSSEADDASGAGGNKKVIPNVSIAVIQPEKLDNNVYSSGTILAKEDVQLQPEISGKVTEILFTEGSRVSKGQVLVKLNDADLAAAVKKLTVQSELAAKNLERQKQLFAVNGVSQDALDQVQSQYDELLAELDGAQAQLAKTQIKAPFSGVIGLKNISEGAFITPATVIAGLQQLDQLKLDFYISEKYADQVRKGDKITFTTDADTNTFSANVYAIDPQIDPLLRSIHVRALINNSEGTIFPGGFAKVQLALKEIDGALMLPAAALIPDLKGQKVFLLKNGKSASVPVVTGLRTDEKVQAIDGIRAGDTVIVTGIMGLRPDMEVNITHN